MSALIRYEDPFRPAYEWSAVLVWAVSGVISLLVYFLTNYPAPLFLGFAALCVVMAVVRLRPVIELWARAKAMDGTGKTFITRQALVELAKQEPDTLVLGFGFPWTQDYAQMAYTLKMHGMQNIVKRDANHVGDRWIHGLGINEEKAIRMPFAHAGVHTFIIGTTGSGKTRLYDLLIAQYIAAGYCVIIIDPKGDSGMHEAARDGARELKNEDVVYFHPAFPERSSRIDPLANFTRTTELASRIASLIASESNSDPFTAFSMKPGPRGLVSPLIICTMDALYFFGPSQLT